MSYKNESKSVVNLKGLVFCQLSVVFIIISVGVIAGGRFCPAGQMEVTCSVFFRDGDFLGI